MTEEAEEERGIGRMEEREEVRIEEPRLLAPARPPRLRGAFLFLILLVLLGMLLLVLTFVTKKISVQWALTIFVPIMGITVGAFAGILLGDLLVQPSSLSRFIGILIAGLLGYLTSVLATAMRTESMSGIVRSLAGQLTTLSQSLSGDPTVATIEAEALWILLFLALFGVATGFFLGFLYAASPRQ